MFLRKHSMWRLQGNTGALGNGSHLWFSSATSGTDGKGIATLANGTFINDSTNIPAGAWFIIPCREAETLMIGYSAKVISFTGDRTIGDNLLRVLALGMPFYQPGSVLFDRPAVTRATAAVGVAHELPALTIVSNPSRTIDVSGHMNDHTLATNVVPSGALVPAGTLANDTYTDFFFSVGKRVSGHREATNVASVIETSTVNVKGLDCVFIAIKNVFASSGGTTDPNYVLDAELFAILDGTRKD